jgi:hypothetical protein
MKILLLDIDGVLNNHQQYKSLYCGINPQMMSELNRIIEIADCRIVLVSAWRYIILGGDMTLKGFGHMLYTHGASHTTCHNLIGHIGPDNNLIEPHDRAKLCIAFLKNVEYSRVVALDDLDLGYTHQNIPFVQTNGNIGLTREDANRVIEILNDHN